MSSNLNHCDDPLEYRTAREDTNHKAAVESLICVRDATFAWAQESINSPLTGVSFDVARGSLTLLVGPVASGKSTLLKSILGETYLLSGSVYFAGQDNVAYCDQDPWILNLSIRENIIGFSEYFDSFYHATVRACQLEEDLRAFPDGDKSVVGSQGLTLSGGQRARIVSDV